MEYGHDDAIKQAQKDFLKVLHLNPAYIKARISLCYNLQVRLYNNMLGTETIICTGEKIYLALS
jgi:hypothetical protein